MRKGKATHAEQGSGLILSPKCAKRSQVSQRLTSVRDVARGVASKHSYLVGSTTMVKVNFRSWSLSLQKRIFSFTSFQKFCFSFTTSTSYEMCPTASVSLRFPSSGMKSVLFQSLQWCIDEDWPGPGALESQLQPRCSFEVSVPSSLKEKRSKMEIKNEMGPTDFKGLTDTRFRKRKRPIPPLWGWRWAS